MKRHLLTILVFAFCAFLMLGCDMADRGEGERDSDTEASTIDGVPTYVDSDRTAESMTEEATHEAVTAEQTESDTEMVTTASEPDDTTEFDPSLYLTGIAEGETPFYATGCGIISGITILCDAPALSPPYSAYCLSDGKFYRYTFAGEGHPALDSLTLMPLVYGGMAGELTLFFAAEEKGETVYYEAFASGIPDIYHADRCFQIYDTYMRDHSELGTVKERMEWIERSAEYHQIPLSELGLE